VCLENDDRIFEDKVLAIDDQLNGTVTPDYKWNETEERYAYRGYCEKYATIMHVSI
jgi:hypothetical protein